MLNIIAHRGFWLDVSEQNTEAAFRKALEHGFGIETDLRDHNQNVVISHDMPTEDSMTFDKFLMLCVTNHDPILALNIKADGLQSALMKKEIKNEHFFFDMSVPDMLGYKKCDLIYFSRYSNIECSPSLYDECAGIWQDNFADEKLDETALLRFLQDGKKVVLVSPELHKKNEELYWMSLKDFLLSYPEFNSRVSLCTDFPLKARGYFNGY